MTSTNLKNTNQMYCQDRARQERIKLSILDNQRIIPGNCMPDLGILSGPMKSGFNHHVLSNNSADIESYLFGIGSTNLAKPKSYRFRPSINNRKKCKFFERPALVLPKDLVVENNQRPIGPFS